MLGHDEYHFVAHHRSAHRKCDSRIAARRFDERVARPDLAALLSAPYHRKRWPVLNRASRVVAFQLCEHHIRSAAWQPFQTDKWCIADEIFECPVHTVAFSSSRAQ